MNKKATLLLPTIIAASVAGHLAQAESELIQVTATRVQEQAFSTLAPIRIFDREDIEQAQVQSLAELLERVAGINGTVQGTAANNASLFIRGGNSDHVLILVDGVRVGSATLGVKQTADLPIELIERVEVVRGPRAALWGSDAISGVIQIFTRKLSANTADLKVLIGSDQQQITQGAFGFGNDQFTATLALSNSASEGFDVISPDPNNPFAIDQNDNDGYRKQSVSLNAAIPWSDFYNVDIIARYDQGNTEFDASFGGDESDYENYFFTVKQHFSWQDFYLQAVFAGSEDSNQDNARELNDFAVPALFTTTRDQFNLLGVHDLNDNTQLLAGVDWYQENVTTNSNLSEDERDAVGVYLAAKRQQQAWLLEASLRSDRVGDIDSEITHQLAVGYTLSPQTQLSFSYGKSFKAPTFNDLYWPDAFGSRGNPELEPETADNYELLLKADYEQLQVEFSLYQTDFDNLIEWAPVDAGELGVIFQPSNIARVKAKGAELSLFWDSFGLDHQLALSHVDARDQLTDKQLVRRPYFSSFYSLTYAWQDWRAFFEFDYQGGRREIFEQNLAARQLFNLGFSYQVQAQLSIQGRVSNALDKEYEEVYEYPGAERAYQLSLRYQFD